LLGLSWALFAAAPVSAAEPPYEFDPTLSLTGNCATGVVDPVPDPSCEGEPPAYPPPPNGPSGRFNESRAIAVDTFGDVYVASWASSNDAKGRIDVFDDEGKFLTEVATPAPKSTAVDSKGTLYVFEDLGKVVRFDPSEFDPEAGKVKYGNPPVTVLDGSVNRAFIGALAVDPANDHLIVAQADVLSIYDSAEGSNALIKTVGEVGHWLEAVAVDGQRERIYLTYCPAGKDEECGVKVLESKEPYAVLKEFDGSSGVSEVPAGQFASPFGRMGLAVDEETGDFFVADIINAKTVYRFSEDYEYLSKLEFAEFDANVSIQVAVSNGERSLAAEPCEYPVEPSVPAGDACNRHYLFVPQLKSAGRALAFHPAGETPPVIEDVSTASVGETEAELRATIFPGGLETTYQFELVTQAAFEAEGQAAYEAEGATILGEGTISADALATEVGAFATGLLPGQTYRFRAVAENSLGPAAEEGQNEATFATYSDSPPPSGCPNQALRTGLSANLPDCRAYELVTPADTNGRPPKGVGFVGNLFSTIEASPAGDAVWFKIEGGSVPGSSGIGSFEGDPYVATRSSSGWTSALAGATGEEATVSIPGSSSPDQHYAFWSGRIEGPLVLNEEETQYLYYPDGHSELIGRGSLGTDPKASGRLITENARHVIFETTNTASKPGAPPKPAIQLEPNAPPTGVSAVYDRTIDPDTGEEVTHVVSLLPGDATPGAGSSYVGASKDGEGIAFSIGKVLYLRVGNEETYEIGENVDFAGVSEGGSRIFYVETGNLKAFDVASEEVIDFSNTGDVTPVNVSAGGTRAYFVSPSVLGGSNPEGDTAQAGEQNVYLSEEGAIGFVATVTDRDVEGVVPPFEATFADGLGLWTEVVSDQLAKDPSRTNPDGSVLLFQSRANITGLEEGESPQVYRYDSGEGRLHCLSCIPTGSSEDLGASIQTITFDSLNPPPLSPSGFVPGLAPDGKRVFFESREALVTADTDNVQDVYEWEEDGVGRCQREGGCLYLISSGQSSRDNFIYGHSTSGDDVFFATPDALTGQDTGGAVSIYDAKGEGGFPEPVNGEPCVGDGCRPGITPPPATPSPATPSPGADDQVPAPRKPKTCPKGKRKVKQHGKVRCVQNKKHKGKDGKAKKRASANGRAGR
jgi:hypothetical protein